MASTFEAGRFTELWSNTIDLEGRLDDAIRYYARINGENGVVIQGTDPILEVDPSNLSASTAKSTLANLLKGAEAARNELDTSYRNSFREMIGYLRANNPVFEVEVKREEDGNHISISIADSDANTTIKLLELVNNIKLTSPEKFLEENMLRIYSLRDSTILHPTIHRSYGEYIRYDTDAKESFSTLNEDYYKNIVKSLHALQETGLVKVNFTYVSRYEAPQTAQAPLQTAQKTG